MILLDSDHLRVLQSRGPRQSALETRLIASGDEEIGTTVVSIEEGRRGWLAEINRRPVREQLPYYERLGRLIGFFADWLVVPFDESALDVFERLRKLRLRGIGTMDLKIAAIAHYRGATLLTANLQHFRLVPDLDVQDWIHG